jgi:hypothetical protein
MTFDPFQNFTDAKIKKYRLFHGIRYNLFGTYWHERNFNIAVKQLAGEFKIKKITLASGVIALYAKEDTQKPTRGK